jgi:hypothetical protein
MESISDVAVPTGAIKTVYRAKAPVEVNSLFESVRAQRSCPVGSVLLGDLKSAAFVRVRNKR